MAAGSSSLPDPPRISRLTGATVLSFTEVSDRHLRRLAAVYIDLDSRGVRCTAEVVTRAMPLRWLRALLKRTDEETADRQAGEVRNGAGQLVIHNTAPIGEPMAPTLLDCREKMGPESGRQSISMLSSPWINKYR